MDSRRILITGLSSYFGGRLAEVLEQDPEVEAIVGVDSQDPTRELQRTEFVRVGIQHALIRKIVQAAEIDTVIDTRLVVDSVTVSPRVAHENNVIGTMNIVAACGGPDSPVRKFVFKSSAHYYGCEQDDPAFFTEEMGRPHPPATPIERDIVEAEATVRDFAERSPEKTVTVLRFANGMGGGIRTSHTDLFALPVVPTILGFDPRYQFIDEDDIVGCLEHAIRHDLPGVFNGAADGVLVLSEVCDLLGKQMAPVIPPWGGGLAAMALRRMGVRIPPEMLKQMRFGRGLDNRRFKAAGFRYRYTTREALIRLAEHLRVRPVLRSSKAQYQYEREVEEFLRWSPSVRLERLGAGEWRPTPQQLSELQRTIEGLQAEDRPAPATSGATAPDDVGSAPPEYGDLSWSEVVSMLPSLEREDLEALRRHEASREGRAAVLDAIDGLLARQVR
ncbi:MAG: UDP-glucose 4-epimerase [Solirubrobacteraceae bacterium]|nr:UDP-glucose 4-epimerase [Solirubrobacteraceae bacterium]